MQNQARGPPDAMPDVSLWIFVFERQYNDFHGFPAYGASLKTTNPPKTPCRSFWTNIQTLLCFDFNQKQVTHVTCFWPLSKHVGHVAVSNMLNSIIFDLLNCWDEIWTTFVFAIELLILWAFWISWMLLEWFIRVAKQPFDHRYRIQTCLGLTSDKGDS